MYIQLRASFYIVICLKSNKTLYKSRPLCGQNYHQLTDLPTKKITCEPHTQIKPTLHYEVFVLKHLTILLPITKIHDKDLEEIIPDQTD